MNEYRSRLTGPRLPAGRSGASTGAKPASWVVRKERIAEGRAPVANRMEINVGVAAFWIALAAVIISDHWFKSRREAMKYETIRQIV